MGKLRLIELIASVELSGMNGYELPELLDEYFRALGELD